MGQNVQFSQQQTRYSRWQQQQQYSFHLDGCRGLQSKTRVTVSISRKKFISEEKVQSFNISGEINPFLTRFIKASTCWNCFSSLFLQIRYGEDGRISLEEILEKHILNVEPTRYTCVGN